MKRSVLIALVAVAFMGVQAFAAGHYIQQSAHNFSTYTWSGGEICKPCHTPHNSAPESVSSRLWNHELTTASYTLKGGASGTAATDMDRVSRLCLSCHDGTVALDSFGGATGTNFVPGKANLGTDLSNDHPVGLDAVAEGTDEGGHLNPITYNANGTSAKISYGGTTLTLYQGTGTHTGKDANGNDVTRNNFVVSCYTCHSAHGEGVGGADSPKLLRASNAGSALCLTCHIK